jgi:hypothetical protein
MISTLTHKIGFQSNYFRPVYSKDESSVVSNEIHTTGHDNCTDTSIALQLFFGFKELQITLVVSSSSSFFVFIAFKGIINKYCRLLIYTITAATYCIRVVLLISMIRIL